MQDNEQLEEQTDEERDAWERVRHAVALAAEDVLG